MMWLPLVCFLSGWFLREIKCYLDHGLREDIRGAIKETEEQKPRVIRP